MPALLQRDLRGRSAGRKSAAYELGPPGDPHSTRAAGHTSQEVANICCVPFRIALLSQPVLLVQVAQCLHLLEHSNQEYALMVTFAASHKFQLLSLSQMITTDNSAPHTSYSLFVRPILIGCRSTSHLNWSALHFLNECLRIMCVQVAASCLVDLAMLHVGESWTDTESTELRDQIIGFIFSRGAQMPKSVTAVRTCLCGLRIESLDTWFTRCCEWCKHRFYPLFLHKHAWCDCDELRPTLNSLCMGSRCSAKPLLWLPREAGHLVPHHLQRYSCCRCPDSDTLVIPAGS